MPDLVAVRQAQGELNALLREYDQVRHAYHHGGASIYDVDCLYTQVCAARRHLAALRGRTRRGLNGAHDALLVRPPVCRLGCR